jgi:hypothetical protein
MAGVLCHRRTDVQRREDDMAAIALPVIIKQVPLDDPCGEPDELVWVIECPHCGGHDSFQEVDQAIRRNTTEAFEVVDGRIVSVVWHLGDRNFQHQRYECGHCGNSVLMEIENEEYA